MAEVETTRDLLVMALQDLHDGERAMVERLGTVQGNLADDACARSLPRTRTAAPGSATH